MKVSKIQEALHQIRNDIGWRLLYLCLGATAMVFIIQFVFDGELNSDVLNYAIPVCIVSYLSGLRDGKREIVSGEDKKDES